MNTPGFRRLLLGLLAGGLAVLLLFIAGEIIVRVFDLFPEITADLEAHTPSAGREESLRNYIHPYLGWSVRPGFSLGRYDEKMPYFQRNFPQGLPDALRGLEVTVNRLGFTSPITDYRDVGPGIFVIGIFGGSSASIFSWLGREELVRALRERLPEIGDSITVLNCGAGGYKQPQQAIALMLCLLLGIRFDVILNLDGFNETGMGGTDASAGQHPLFPSRQHLIPTVSIGAGVLTPEAIELSAEVLREQRCCDRLSARARRPAWRRSRLAQTIFGSLYRGHAVRAQLAEKRLQDLSLGSSGGRAVASLSADPAVKWDLIAQIWAQSSRYMAGLARSAGAVYVHLLQPNQYVDGSKPISEEERRYAFKPGHEWSRHAREGHPYLQRAGAEMAREGLHFHDLTGIFSNRAESLYVDDICHFNYEGNRIIAEAAAAAIADAWRAEKGPARVAP